MNEAVEKAVDQAGNLASAAKEAAPGFFDKALELAKTNKYALGAIGALGLTFCFGRYIFPKRKKRRNH